MSFDPRKQAIDEHKRWMGYLQPEGVVVAPVALVDHGVQLDASTFATTQERFLASVARDAETGAPVIPHFAHFARTFLGWRDDLLDIYAVEAEVPDALRFSTGEFGELLYPDAALRFLAPSDSGKPWMLFIRQLRPGTKFDEISEAARASGWVASPAQKFERLLRAKDIPIGLMANGAEVRLLYAPRGENVGSLTFPVRFMTELAGRAVASAFEMLLSHRRLIAVAEAARLPALLKKSREYQGAVSTALAEQVLEALYELIRGFQAADAQVDRKLLREVLARDPDEVYHALLTLLLRLVFLLFAEDRGLMPGGSLYQRNYSIHGLFEKLRAARERHPDTMDSRFGAYAQILTLCRIVYQGSRHWDLAMPARHGHLFESDRFPFLEGRENARADVRAEGHQLPLVSDGTLFRVLEKLLLLDGERLSYRALDVEQIGSVYQTMIGFTMDVAKGTSIALKPAKSKGAPAFLDLDALLAIDSGKRAEHLQKLTDHKLTGNPAAALKTAQTHDDLLAALERKIARAASPDKVAPGSLILQPTDERRRSGSHYTPRVLTAPIVRKTLDPILARLGKNPTPQQILELKICDKAVGSGAFLVEGCRQLGDALVAAWQHHGGKPVIPPDEDELLHARRLVAQRCLYGVDRNPMAVDLAKLSLWLATLAKDHPFTFLDHSLRAGDALVGLGKKQIVAFHWDLTAPEAKQRQFGQQRVEKAIELATSFRREILEGGDFLMPDVKAERLKRADSALDEARRAGDLCIAAFFGGDKPKPRAALRERYLDTLIAIVSANPLPFDKIKEVEAIIAQLRKGAPHPVTPFHWEIEFPEVFARENGGFDAFIGNPPFMGGTNISESSGMPYFQWLVTAFEPCEHHCDLVAYFFRRGFNLVREGGTLGLIATNTIAQGDTREGGLRILLREGGQIFNATRRFKWPGLAAVIVSVVHVAKGFSPIEPILDGQRVSRISAYLFDGQTDESPARLATNPYFSLGSKIYGQGFIFRDGDPECSPVAERERIIRDHPEWESRIPPYIGGEEINTDPRQQFHRYVICLSDVNTEEELNEWPDLRDIVAAKVRPERELLGSNPNNTPLKKRWWAFQAHRPELYQRLGGMDRVLVSSQVSAQFVFTILPTTWIFAHTANVFCVGTFSGFALIQGRVHEVWARFLGSSMKDDLRYTASDCFETFPFPAGWETDAALEAAGREYYEARAALMVSHHEGLTKTYNRFHDPAEDAPGIHRLRRLHAALDHAVLAAYGWSDLVETGRCACEFLPDYYDEPEQEGGDPIPKSIRHRWPDATRDEVLARLLKLNAERAKQEGKQEGKQAKADQLVAKPAKARREPTGVAPAQGEIIPSPQRDLFT